MASVFGIDLIKSTTGLFRNVRSRKKSSPWGGAENGYAGLANYERNNDVGRLVEDEIIPRLLMVHQDDPRMTHFPSDQIAGAQADTPTGDAQAATRDFRVTSGTQSNDNAIGAEQQQYRARPLKQATGSKKPTPVFDDAAIDAFTADVLANEADVLSEMVGKHLDQGVEPEALFIELIGPTARRLGDKWTNDECDFVDVTMGLWRLQQVLRTVAAWAPPAPGWCSSGHNALFTTMPGDQHSLGTLIISECFQRGGWEVETLIEPQQSDIFDAIKQTSYDVIGLTVTTDLDTVQVARLLASIRNVSRNPNMAIMIGGPAIGYDPELARKLGADGTAPDASAALKLADQLVSVGLERSALSF